MNKNTDTTEPPSAEARDEVTDTKPVEETAPTIAEINEMAEKIDAVDTSSFESRLLGLHLLDVRTAINSHNAQPHNIKITDLNWYEEVRESEAFLNIYKKATGQDDPPPSKRELDQMFKKLVDYQNEGKDIAIELDSTRGLRYFLIKQS